MEAFFLSQFKFLVDLSNFVEQKFQKLGEKARIRSGSAL